MPYQKLKEEHYTNLGGMDIKSSNYITEEGEVLRLVNMDYTTPGAWTKVPGTTLFIGATVAGSITGINQFTRLSGASYLVVSANTNVYAVSGAFNPIRTGTQNSLFDFVPFVDRLWAANGNDFFKTDGVLSTNFSLPPGASFTAAISGNGLTGDYIYAIGYLNDRGYYGPPSVGHTMAGLTNDGVLLSGLSAPAGYGISAIVIYRTSDGLEDLFLLNTISASATSYTDNGATALSDTLANNNLWFTLAPRYIELFNNQLFMSGFSSMLSTVYFSDIGEPEAVGATAFFEVRTNDGDRVTGMRAYYGSLVIGKERSFHVLSGDNPLNFTLEEKSTQYGFLSNRAAIVFEDKFQFLDTKGVCQFNGANIDIVSDRVEPIFLRMNIDAARDSAAMLHVKERNEIWTLIPVDGSTLLNQLIVYDYNADSWYERRGLNISTLALVIDEMPYPTPFYGGYTGSLFNFAESLCGDNGEDIECRVFTRFHAPMGFSTQKVFRRLFLDVTPLPVSIGGTCAITVNFFKDQDLVTPCLTREMFGATWQTRIDYGVSAKSLAYELIHTSATQPLQINGYTIANRFQREV